MEENRYSRSFEDGHIIGSNRTPNTRMCLPNAQGFDMVHGLALNDFAVFVVPCRWFCW